ncbi:MAG: stage III sporulation AC/AD family protein [Oscillospiraceae bacterium]
MELLLKVFALCVITAAVASLLRRNEGELALLLALCAAACAAALLIAAGEPLAALLRTLAEKTGLSGAVFTPLWKVLAIALTVRVGGAFCRDAAQGALASVLETAGAVCALTADRSGCCSPWRSWWRAGCEKDGISSAHARAPDRSGLRRAASGRTSRRAAGGSGGAGRG